MEELILKLIACPETLTDLNRAGDKFVSESGKTEYPVYQGIPILRPGPVTAKWSGQTIGRYREIRLQRRSTTN
ncbi:MAG: hypothetical protein U5N86_09500 [Planctomycetota bacterium]|nr:hypothetical protein [Planctomycetota bacterium]